MSPTETLVKESVESVEKLIDEASDKVIDKLIVEAGTENINNDLQREECSEKKQGKVISYWSISRVDNASAEAAKLYLDLSQESKLIQFEDIQKNA